jgi:hypothetical protein
VRLLSAMLVLFLSIVSLAVGIALRTVWAGPDTLIRTVEIDHTAPVIVIPGDTLVSHPGRQTVTVVDPEPTAEVGVIVAYGRTTDVMGWIRPSRFTTILHDDVADSLYAVPRLGSQSQVPPPLNSDLWLEQYRETEAVKVSLTGDENISVVIFSDGKRAAPGVVQLSWPLDNVSPFAGLLVALGIIAMVIGFILLAIALADIRRRRGPRRKTPVAPKRKAPKRLVSRRPSSPLPRRGRRRLERSAVVLPLIGILSLGSCAPMSETEPAPQQPADETTPAAPAPLPPYPAVTEAQFRTIVERVANQVLLADQALDAGLLESRMANPTFTMREAQYRLRDFDQDLGQILPVSTTPIRLLVPQQTREWPRVVFAVVQEGAEANSPSVGLVLRQESARSDYQLIYHVLLAPDVILPAMPTVDVGAPRLARDSKLLPVSPADTVAGYADVLARGPESPAWRSFDTLTDDLYTLVGPDGQQLRRESFGSDLELELAIDVTDDQIVALATRENGALVFGVITETESVRPVESGANINATPAVRALTGQPQSPDGFSARYDMHVVWYVPPIGSDERIRVVGYSYALVDAEELEPREE